METLLSRPSHSNPAGKCDRRLDIPIPEELENAIVALATLRGMSKAEYGRMILERSVLGEFAMVQKIAVHGA